MVEAIVSAGLLTVSTVALMGVLNSSITSVLALIISMTSSSHCGGPHSFFAFATMVSLIFLQTN